MAFMDLLHNCLLCGMGIGPSEIPGSNRWLHEYRAVYRDNKGTHVTGVGWPDYERLWRPPRDPARRWDDGPEPYERLEIPVMRQNSHGGIHGFVIHEICWKILHKAIEPGILSVERLVLVCESIPIPRWFDGLLWPHDYAGLLKLRMDNAYPWLDPVPDVSRGSFIERRVIANPAGVAGNPLLSSTWADRPPMSVPIPFTSTDCFSRLPWELLEAIAAELQTRDALNLRLASRSFLAMISSFAFWTSRYRPDAERGFMYEIRDPRANFGAHMLMHLYRRSRRSIATPGMLSRERVWWLARGLVPIIQPPLATSTNQQLGYPSSIEWVHIGGQENPSTSLDEYEPFVNGCRAASTINMACSGAVKIGIALLNTGAYDYVTGIRIIDGDGHEQFAGYAFNNREIVCSLSTLYGFRVAMAHDGLRALQVISDRQQAWIGRPDYVPLSDRLVMDKPVIRLNVSFDGFKVTGLEVGVKRPRREDAVTSARDFRHIALWYPDKPPPHLLTNGDSYTGEDPLLAVFEPLAWLHFGGTAGSSLKHLGGILIHYFDGVHSLQFVYDEAHGSRFSHKIGGHCNPSQAQFFPINGAGGERMEFVCVGTRHWRDCPLTAAAVPHHGILECAKIITNWDRTIFIGDERDDLPTLPLEIAQGTTITGLYGHYDRTFGFMNMGVISEHL